MTDLLWMMLWASNGNFLHFASSRKRYHFICETSDCSPWNSSCYRVVMFVDYCSLDVHANIGAECFEIGHGITVILLLQSKALILSFSLPNYRVDSDLFFFL